MTEPRFDRTLKLRAIVYALVTFAILHVLLLLAARAIAGNPERIATVVPLLNVAAYLIYLVAGFIAGVFARAAPILHGVAAGFFASLIAIVFFGATESNLPAVAILIANGIIFGGIGGACSLLCAREEPSNP
jgi:ACR3 family arsenite efflux pump ArsB